MHLKEERTNIVEMGRRILREGFTRGTGGNLSIYNPKEGLFAITPSGIPYEAIEIEDICILDLEGNLIEGNIPSSELEMHRLVYKNRDDIRSLIHAHTVYSTAVGLVADSLPSVHYMIGLAGNDVRVASYAIYGSRELAQNALEAMEDRLAVLLKNHGILVGGCDLNYCLNALEEIEYVARLYMLAKSVGEPKVLSNDEMDMVREKFKGYGK